MNAILSKGNTHARLAETTSSYCGPLEFNEFPVSSKIHTYENNLLYTPEKKTPIRPPDFWVTQSQPINKIDTGTTIVQIWEGCVLCIDKNSNSMQVKLLAKIGDIPEHTGTIDLQYVSEQDIDLVVPGAIFYLTLFNRITRGSIENAQELRFRRLPNWSKNQLKKISERAEKFLAKITPTDDKLRVCT